MLRLFLYSALIALWVTTPSLADDSFPASSAPEALTNEFFGDLQAGKSIEAWRFAFKDFAGGTDDAGLTRAAAQTDAYMKNFGNISKWSSIKTVNITDNLRREVFYVELEKAPLFFEFLYYKHDNAWKITNINMDTYATAKTKGFFDDK